jgi:hypothetical protein
MSDEQKIFSIVQGAPGSELSVNYNAENITIVKVLYQLDKAKKNKDLDSFEELVNISEAVFLQDKFNQLPLEDRMRFENLMGDHTDLKDRFYEFRNEVLNEHFPGIETEFETYRGLFESARNEIYESTQIAENNEIKLEKFKAEAEIKLVQTKAKEEHKLKNEEGNQIRKTMRLESKLKKREGSRNIVSQGLEDFMNKEDGFPATTKFTGRFVVPGILTYVSLSAINQDFDWFMSGYDELLAGSLIGLIGGVTWNFLYYKKILQ